MANTRNRSNNTNRQSQRTTPAPKPEPTPVVGTETPDEVSAAAGDPSTVTPVTDPQTANAEASMEGVPDRVGDPVVREGVTDGTENGPQSVADGQDGSQQPQTPDSPGESPDDVVDDTHDPLVGEQGYVGGDDYDPSAAPAGRILHPGEEFVVTAARDEFGVLRAIEDVHRRVYAHGGNRYTFMLLIRKGQEVTSSGAVIQYR